MLYKIVETHSLPSSPQEYVPCGGMRHLAKKCHPEVATVHQTQHEFADCKRYQAKCGIWQKLPLMLPQVRLGPSRAGLMRCFGNSCTDECSDEEMDVAKRPWHALTNFKGTTVRIQGHTVTSGAEQPCRTGSSAPGGAAWDLRWEDLAGQARRAAIGTPAVATGLACMSAS